MLELTVADVPIDSAPTIDPETSATEAARILHDPSVSALVVLEEGDVVGVVTESDFVTLVAENRGGCDVRGVMSSPVITISPAASVSTAAERMQEAGVKRLVVVDDGAYRGLVSASTLLPYLPPYRLEVDQHCEPLDLTAAERTPADEPRAALEATPKP